MFKKISNVAYQTSAVSHAIHDLLQWINKFLTLKSLSFFLISPTVQSTKLIYITLPNHICLAINYELKTLQNAVSIIQLRI
jgi:hypothetical protein